MPALPNVPKVLLVKMFITDGADVNSMTRFHVSYTGTAPTNAQLITYCGSLATAWGADLSPLCPSTIALNEISCTDLSSPTAGVGSSSFTDAGTRTGAPLPAGAAVIANYLIGRRYRGGQPKGYWPFGVAADLATQQNWTSGFLTSMASGLGAFFTSVAGSGWTGAGTLGTVNVSYYSGFTNHTYPSGRTRPIPTPRGTPLVDTINGISINPKVGSQRRRNLHGK